MTNLVASAFDPGVYGALANVAAITTALQSIVALLALQRGLDLANVGGSRPTAESAAAKRAASRNFWGQGVLNLVALFVNAAVLAAWFKVGVVPVCPEQWELWLPCAAVALGCIALTTTAVVGLTKLGHVARRP